MDSRRGSPPEKGENKLEETYQNIEQILDNYVRPRLREHGGSIQLECIRNDTAYVRLGGHCSGCPSAKYTIESLVEEELRKHTDVVKSVRLQEDVSKEIYDFAKTLLKEKRNENRR